MREDKGLTQEALALKVARLLKRPDEGSPLRHYHRVEQTGQTSSAYAAALASVLGVSGPLLQGPEGPGRCAYPQCVGAL